MIRAILRLFYLSIIFVINGLDYILFENKEIEGFKYNVIDQKDRRMYVEHLEGCYKQDD